MNLRSFLKLVEIKTKTASMLPFIIGTLFCIYRFNSFNLFNFIIMFISLITFDMATTTLNNYIDYLSDKKKRGYGYEEHNSIVKYKIPLKFVNLTLGTLLIIAIVSGFILFIRTNILVLIIGIISFIIGIIYTFGPIPISRTPFGELFSGFFMGFVIIFLSIYIHLNNELLVNLYSDGFFTVIKFNIVELFIVLLISIPSITGISNIMLANNICDMEEDKSNERYTLPLYIGKEYSLRLFNILYLISFFSIILSVIIKVVPLVCLLSVLTIIPITNNIKLFYEKQSKSETFHLSVINYLIIGASFAFTMLIGIIF